MTEAQFNTIIKNSLDWGHKISDGGIHGKLPFDGFGSFRGKPVYWEAKWLKKPQAFPWSRFEDHQLQALLDLQKTLPNAWCLLIVGIDYGRASKRVYIYSDPGMLHHRKYSEEKSIKKKEFDATGQYIIIKNNLIDFTNLLL